MKRGMIVLKWILLAILFSALSLILWNQICKHRDAKLISNAYGQTVDVGGRKMVVDIQGEENETTIILLPGSASASPVLEFLPLAKALSEQYRVITIEPFGYGLSDAASTDRDIHTVVKELHQCVSALGYDRYYLMAHSLSGLYSLCWTNSYPDEVLGFIGIDTSVPGQNEENPYPISITAINKIGAYLQKAIYGSGVARLMSMGKPWQVINADLSYHYSENEIRVYRTLSLDHSYNPTVMNELDHFDVTLETVKNMKFPQNTPVLQFVASANCEVFTTWEPLHKAVISEDTYSKVIRMEGGHYLHLMQKAELAEMTAQWIASLPGNSESAMP